MKVITTKEIDGLKVVTSIVNKPIDPMASQRACVNALKETEEYKAYEDAVKESELVPPAHKSNVTDMQRWKKQMGESLKKISEAKKEMDIVHRKLARQNIVHFPLSENEREFSPSLHKEFSAKFYALKKREFITPEGEVIKDYRGMTFIRNEKGVVEVTKIEKLSDVPPKGSIDIREAKEDSLKILKSQSRKKAIANLTAEEKKYHLEKELKSLSTKLSYQVTAAEVQGKSREEALKIAQAEYKDLASKIEAEYKG